MVDRLALWRRHQTPSATATSMCRRERPVTGNFTSDPERHELADQRPSSLTASNLTIDGRSSTLLGRIATLKADVPLRSMTYDEILFRYRWPAKDLVVDADGVDPIGCTDAESIAKGLRRGD